MARGVPSRDMGVLSHMGIFEAKWRNWGRKCQDLRASTCLFLIMCGRTWGGQSMVRVRRRKRQLQGPSHMQVFLATQSHHRRVYVMSQRTALADVKVLDLSQFDAGTPGNEA